MLRKIDFDILTKLEAEEGNITQRELAKYINKSVGTVNITLNKLENERLISSDKKLTEIAYEELENYRVDKVVIMAAGFGSRLVPITLNTPKPLVRVFGVRIIDSLLDSIYQAGIKDITIVRGYLKEQFDQLLIKYPTIKFIDNPEYNESNNISSVYYAREYLQNAYIAEADLLVKNPKLITRYQYSTNYLGFKCEYTDDWCFHSSSGQYIDYVSVGGRNVYQMVGISYWTKEDGEKLKNDIEKIWTSPGGKEKYWDLVPLDVCKNDFKISIRQCAKDDITEIDTFKELQLIDPSYKI